MYGVNSNYSWVRRLFNTRTGELYRFRSGCFLVWRACICRSERLWEVWPPAASEPRKAACCRSRGDAVTLATPLYQPQRPLSTRSAGRQLLADSSGSRWQKGGAYGSSAGAKCREPDRLHAPATRYWRVLGGTESYRQVLGVLSPTGKYWRLLNPSSDNWGVLNPSREYWMRYWILKTSTEEWSAIEWQCCRCCYNSCYFCY